jgi:hypothetical protein
MRLVLQAFLVVKELLKLKQHTKKEVILQKAISVLSELGSHYEKADADKKLKLLGSIFPEMIEFDGEKCRTPSINEGLALCLNADKVLSGIKNGTIHENLELSRLVTLQGFEPRTSASVVQYSIQLSYRAQFRAANIRSFYSNDRTKFLL